MLQPLNENIVGDKIIDNIISMLKGFNAHKKGNSIIVEGVKPFELGKVRNILNEYFSQVGLTKDGMSWSGEFVGVNVNAVYEEFDNFDSVDVSIKFTFEDLSEDYDPNWTSDIDKDEDIYYVGIELSNLDVSAKELFDAVKASKDRGNTEYINALINDIKKIEKQLTTLIADWSK